MSPRYDAVVVGAGLGGLSAAATLAKAGLHVRVFERHTQPGGYATTFVRERFEFEVSLHALSGLGMPGRRGDLWRLLEHYGVTDRVEFLQIDPLYRSVAPGMDFRMPNGRGPALDVLCRTFPSQRKGLTRLMDKVFAIGHEIDALGGGDPPSSLGAVARFPNLTHAAMVPVSAVLDRELDDPLAKLAFCQLWGYFGLPPSKLSLLWFAGGVSTYLQRGAWYPKGKSQALSNALAAVVEENGGRVSLGHGVRSILTRDGRVTGVLTDQDDMIECDTVVSNANPFTTCMELLGPEKLPASYLQRVNASPVSLSSFCVYLGLACDHRRLGLVDHEVFVNDSADMDAHYKSYLTTEAPEAMLLGCYNATDPGFSPEGTSAVVLVSLADGEAWSRVSPADYPDLKARLADGMLARAEQLYPGIRDQVEVAVTSTPLTNMRYTGNPNGAIYGIANVPAENPGWRLGHRVPVDGLWLAGAWTQPGGGYEPCILSGHLAARKALARLRGSK